MRLPICPAMMARGRTLHKRWLVAYARCERGASAGEYALLLAIVAGCAFVALHRFGHHIGGAFNNVSTALK